MRELINYQFIQNALCASLLLSVVVGFIGSYIVARRLVFLSGGITHASFGGIGVAWYFGLNPIFGASVFAVLSALGLELLTKQKSMREDSAIGMLWSLGMAIGVFFVFLTPGYAPNLMSYLFGNILTVSLVDIYQLLVLVITIGIFFALFYYPILFIAFDEEYAQAQVKGYRFVSFALKILVALSIVFSIRAIGIILLISLLTIPANIANLFTKKFNVLIAISAAISLLAMVLGVVISYKFNIPSGATAVLVLVGIFGLAKILTVIKTWAIR